MANTGPAAAGAPGGDFESTWARVLRDGAQVARHFLVLSQAAAQVDAPGTRWYQTLPALLFAPSAELRRWAQLTLENLPQAELAARGCVGTVKLVLAAVADAVQGGGRGAPLAGLDSSGGAGAVVVPAPPSGIPPIPIVVDLAVAWAGVCCLAELEGAPDGVSAAVGEFLVRAARRVDVYVPQGGTTAAADGGDDRTDCVLWLLRSCAAAAPPDLPVDRVAALAVAESDAAAAFPDPTEAEQLATTARHVLALLCDVWACYPHAMTEGDVAALTRAAQRIRLAEHDTGALLQLAPLAATSSAAGRSLARQLLWPTREAALLLLDAPGGCDALVAAAAAAVRETLDLTLEWATYMANAYVAALDHAPLVELGRIMAGVPLPACGPLLEALGDRWERLPAACRGDVAGSVLPLGSLLDAQAFEAFAKFTRLAERLEAAHYATPLAELFHICNGVDYLGQQAVAAAPGRDGANVLVMAFLLTPQHRAAHAAAVDRLPNAGGDATAAIVHLAGVSAAARQWIGIGLRACCETHAGKITPQAFSARLKEYVTDVRLAVFGQVAAAVITSLARAAALSQQLEPEYVTAVLSCAQRCVAFWRTPALGVGYPLVMEAAQHAVPGEWEASIMRCVASAATEADGAAWAGAMSRLAARGAYRKDGDRARLARILKGKKFALPALQRLAEEGDAAAAQLLQWAAGGAAVAVTEVPPAPPAVAVMATPPRTPARKSASPPPPGRVEIDVDAAPETPQQSQASSAVQPQYSLSMLDGGDVGLYEDEEGEVVEIPPPAPTPPPPAAAAPSPKKKAAMPLNATFIDLATRTLAPTPTPRQQRKSTKQRHVERLARIGGGRGGLEVELQDNGAAHVYSNHQYGTSKAVELVAPTPGNVQRRQLAAAAAGSRKHDTVRKGDKQYQASIQIDERKAVVAAREVRYAAQKKCLLKALLEVDADAPSTVSLPQLQQRYADEAEYAATLFPFVVEEATAQVRAELQEFRFTAPDHGAVSDCYPCDARAGEVVVEFEEYPGNHYTESDVVAVVPHGGQQAGLILGKVEQFHKRFWVLKVRVAPSRARYLPLGAGVKVEPLARIAAAFSQTYMLNHTYDLSGVRRSLFTSAPAAGLEQRFERHAAFMNVVPRPFLAFLGRNYNASQREAILKSASLREGLSLIQGPPGTGKTHTVMGLLSALLMRGAPSKYPAHARVLLVAPSNAAVNELMQRLFTTGLRGPDGKKWVPKMLRVGVREKMPDLVKGVCVDDIVDHRLGENKKVRDGSLAAVEARVVQAKADLDRALKHMQEHPRGTPEHVRAQAKVNLLRKVLSSENVMKRQKIDAAFKERRTMRNEILAEAHIVASTLGSCRTVPGTFTAVVVDEAAQAVEPDVLLALGKGTKLCVLVGDDKQLPATVISRAALAAGYAVPLFRRLRQGGHAPFLLRTQYRMHPVVRSLPDRLFYGGQLFDHKSIAERPQLPVQPFFVVDAARGAVHPVGRSYGNTAEAAAVAHVVGNVLARCGGPPINLTAKDIGVISPYKGQVKHIAEMMRGAPAMRGVEVSTVDGFQGREKRVIVISTVRAPRRGPDGGGDLGIGFLKSPQRLNVAMTRARDAVAVVCHARTMGGSPMWQQLLDAAAAQQGLYKPEDFERADGFVPAPTDGLDAAALKLEPADTAPDDECLAAMREHMASSSASSSRSPENAGAAQPKLPSRNRQNLGDGINAPIRMARQAPGGGGGGAAKKAKIFIDESKIFIDEYRKHAAAFAEATAPPADPLAAPAQRSRTVTARYAGAPPQEAGKRSRTPSASPPAGAPPAKLHCPNGRAMKKPARGKH